MHVALGVVLFCLPLCAIAGGDVALGRCTGTCTLHWASCHSARLSVPLRAGTLGERSGVHEPFSRLRDLAYRSDRLVVSVRATAAAADHTNREEYQSAERVGTSDDDERQVVTARRVDDPTCEKWSTPCRL